MQAKRICGREGRAARAPRARLVAALLVAVLGATAGAPAAARPVTIGVLLDGPAERLQTLRPLVERELLALTAGEFDVRFPGDKQLAGDWTLPGIGRQLERLLADPQVDLVMTLGVLGSHAAARRGRLPKPVIAPYVVDIDLQGLPHSDNRSGVRNLNYLASFDTARRDIGAFKEIVPFRHLAVIVNGAVLEAIPALRVMGEELARHHRIRLSVVPVAERAQPALDALAGDIDAVLVVPLPRLTEAEFDRLVAGIRARRLPSFSMWGREEVERGLLASLAVPDDLPRLARRVALNVQRILLGEAAAELPVAFDRRERLAVNMATARAVGAWPNWEVLTEAELLNEEPQAHAVTWSLAGAVQEAVRVNLELEAAGRAVAAGEHAVRGARAALLPQIEASADAQRIDDDRAAAALGQAPERSSSTSLALRQLLYAEDARASFEVERLRQQARELDREQLRLDVALEAALAYLGVLKAETLEQVQKDNLSLTRSNLEQARIRRALGVARPAEVFRWESEIANNRRAVIDAQAARRAAQTALNRVLHRPLEQAFATAETTLQGSRLSVADPRFARYVANPWRFRVFRDFLVEEGLARSPELRGLQAALDAQQRLLTAARRAYYAPVVSAQLSVSETLSRSGAGAAPVPGRDDTDWAVGLNLTLPLYQCGGRGARVNEARETLEQLRLQRAASAERIEEGIRSDLHGTGATYPGIRLSQQAAEAARKNLELVADAYARGAVSILDLLDAQNASLTAQAQAASAEYDFLIDLMRVQRASAFFEILATPAEREDWFGRLEEHFQRAGADLARPPADHPR